MTESPVTFDRKSRDNSWDTVEKLLPAVEVLPLCPTGPGIRRVLGIRLRGEDGVRPAVEKLPPGPTLLRAPISNQPDFLEATCRIG